MHIATYMGGPIQTKAYRVLRTHVYDCLDDYRLNPTKWALLGLVQESRDGIRLAQAAQVLGVKAPLITAIADELTLRGYIQRVPHHIDRRAKLLVVTPMGKKFIKQVEESVTERLRRLLKGTTPEDLIAYHKVLDTIISNDTTTSNKSF